MCEGGILRDIKNIPEKSSNETLIDYAESLTDWYIERTPPGYRKKRGQFFTPGPISNFMVKQYEGIDKKNEIWILDPGAGVGIFESTFCEYLLSLGRKSKILFTLYENDENLVLLLRKNMRACKRVMADNDFNISYRIINEDFILSNALKNKIKENKCISKKCYDLVLSNPPYYKINRDDPRIAEMKNLSREQPNIYSLFMTLSAILLKDRGQMVIITPRSYCSGLFFKKFRKWFFNIVKPLKIHIFNSRNEVFKKYNVLQENVILTAMKTSGIPKEVLVSISNGRVNENEELKVITTTYDKIIIEKGDDIIMRIPTSELDELVAMHIDRFSNNMGSFGLKVSTGRVVPFRAKDYLLNDVNMGRNYVPLIWMQNIVNGKVTWPNQMNNKFIAIESKEDSNKLLVPKGNYVLIKRISSKEGKQRVNAGVLLEKFLSSNHIGIENHVNYIHKPNGKLTEDEAYGITALLNSRLYNIYFQMENGSTQVNATEIINIPFPSLEKIRKIGSLVRKEEENDEIRNEKIIARELNIDGKIIMDLIAKK